MDFDFSATLTSKLTPYEELLTKFFECPVCLSTMLPPIYRCSVGHSICKDCHQRVTSCPRCRLPRINKRAPAPLENICMILRFPCKYEIDGCDYIGQADALKIHFQVCKFQPVKCPVRYWVMDCQWNKAEKDLAAHILQDHQDKVLIGNSQTFNSVLRGRCLPNSVVFIYAFGRVFRALWQVNAEKGTYKFAVNIMEKSANEKYKYTLSILPAVDYIPTFKYTSLCSCLKTDERWIYPGAGADIRYTFLRDYINTEKELTYRVTIEKRTEINEDRNSSEHIHNLFFNRLCWDVDS